MYSKSSLQDHHSFIHCNKYLSNMDWLCVRSCSRYWKYGKTVVNKENKVLDFIHRESQ